jgi:hypothetical protein
MRKAKVKKKNENTLNKSSVQRFGTDESEETKKKNKESFLQDINECSLYPINQYDSNIFKNNFEIEEEDKINPSHDKKDQEVNKLEILLKNDKTKHLHDNKNEEILEMENKNVSSQDKKLDNQEKRKKTNVEDEKVSGETRKMLLKDIPRVNPPASSAKCKSKKRLRKKNKQNISYGPKYDPYTNTKNTGPK